MDLDERLQSIEADPEMASLNMGIINYPMPAGDGFSLSLNSSTDIAFYAEKMLERNIKPEMEVYSVAMMKDVHMLIEKGLLKKPYYINFVMGMPAQGTLEATRQNLFYLIDMLPADSVFQRLCARALPNYR